MKTALVIGLGISGKSAAGFLERQGFKVLAHDDKQLPEGFKKFDGDFTSVDLVVVSPGIPRTHPLYVQAKEKNIEVIGEVELACRSIRNPVLAVTGTNGKTTVTQLIEHILKFAGKPVKLLGNGGIPITAQIGDSKEEILVLELSSFQLETMESPIIDAAAILNITPDHLDRYNGMEEYAKAKMHIHRCLKPGGSLFIEERAFLQYGYLLEGFPCQIYSSADLTTTHDTENYLAALALVSQLGISPELVKKAYESFRKPPHRIEFVEKIGGVSYYNDSKGTNIDAVIRCIQSLPGPIILIAGGVDKGASYTSWIEPFHGKVKMIMTIGLAAPIIERELDPHFPIKRGRDLADALEWAKKFSVPGDSIVLSPGCASYDMFRDYAHRGDEFKRLVLRS